MPLLLISWFHWFGLPGNRRDIHVWHHWATLAGSSRTSLSEIQAASRASYLKRNHLCGRLAGISWPGPTLHSLRFCGFVWWRLGWLVVPSYRYFKATNPTNEHSWSKSSNWAYLASTQILWSPLAWNSSGFAHIFGVSVVNLPGCGSCPW